jgi:hypothetical protein
VVKFTGKQSPIDSMMDTLSLYPTVSICSSISVEANFGDNIAKPFKYDIDKCPGREFE